MLKRPLYSFLVAVMAVFGAVQQTAQAEPGNKESAAIVENFWTKQTAKANQAEPAQTAQAEPEQSAQAEPALTGPGKKQAAAFIERFLTKLFIEDDINYALDKIDYVRSLGKQDSSYTRSLAEMGLNIAVQATRGYGGGISKIKVIGVVDNGDVYDVTTRTEMKNGEFFNKVYGAVWDDFQEKFLLVLYQQ